MSDKAKQLYTDNQIYQLMIKHGLAWTDYADRPNAQIMNGAQVAKAMLEMSARYEAALKSERAKATELEAQLEQARHWLPESVLSEGDEDE